ncbi:MAG TPA: peptidoglycan-binding domain-containing protein [Xanthobacteraceae bacterium]|jgi:peptidoglycan hydrolase-like protein with peptidoglycan-binding domain|nr:peptidoglycan-binding domain-containing protein [Xanthobacteraceae bacterium]
MRGIVCSVGAAAIVALLSALPVAASEEGGAEASTSPAAAAPSNTPEQIKRAQVELKRLDCLNGRIDGKLGERTREAVKKFWASAKRPPITVINITDELIADLADHGDNYCRPPRHVFFFGGRSGNPAKLPFLAPGGKVAPPAPPPQVTPPTQP